MRKMLWWMSLFFAAGCAHVIPFSGGKEIVELKNTVQVKEAQLADRDAEIASLKTRIMRLEEQLRDKETQLQELKNKLNSVGVF